MVPLLPRLLLMLVFCGTASEGHAAALSEPGCMVRGLGIGRKLLIELERRARTLKLKMLHLESNESLEEARALYRSAGYVEVEPFNNERYAHHWFQKRIE